MKLAVTVCNVCKDVTRSTRSWTVIQEGNEHDLDLCNEHSEPLVTLLAATAPSEQPAGRLTPVPTPVADKPSGRSRAVPTKVAARKTGRRGSTPAMTLDQLEAAKSQK